MEGLYTVGGKVNWCFGCRKQRAARSETLKMELPYDSAFLSWVNIWRKLKLIRKATRTHLSVYSSIIYNCQDMKAKLSVHQQMVDKEDVVCIYHGLLPQP